jgi:hypothetical protein
MIPGTAAREVIGPRPPPVERGQGGDDDPAGTATDPAPTGQMGPRPADADAVVDPGVATNSWSAAFSPAGYDTRELTTRGALIIGIVALVLVSFTPQVRWVHVSESHATVASEERAAAIRRGASRMLGGSNVGPTLLVYSALMAVLAALCLLSLNVLPPESFDSLIAGVSGLASGWGVTVSLLMVGYVGKAFATAGEPANQQLTVLPGFGPILGLFAALAAVAVFAYLAASRGRFLWLAGPGVLGLLLGVLLTILSVHPWEAWRAEF